MAAAAAAEIKVQRSRFLAEAAPAATEEEARAALAGAQRSHHDCRHVAFAWCGGPAAARREWRGDGGEPAGTAGEPILAALRSADVADAVVTVARWFGGIKLGTGGLARAYHEAAAAALAAAPRRRVTPGAEGGVAFPYAWQGTLARLLARHEGRVVSEQYGETAVWRVWLPLGAWSAFAAEACDATAGAAKIEAPV